MRSSGEFDHDESLRRDANGERPVLECSVLRRGRLACSAQLRDLIASWKCWPVHCIVCFDDISVVGVETPDLHRGIWGDTGEFYGECLWRADVCRGRQCVGCAGAEGRSVVPEGDCD